MSREFKDWQQDRISDYQEGIKRSKKIIENLIISIEENKRLNDTRIFKVPIENAQKYFEFLDKYQLIDEEDNASNKQTV